MNLIFFFDKLLNLNFYSFKIKFIKKISIYLNKINKIFYNIKIKPYYENTKKIKYYT